jgi:SH3-like domain-containing protein
MPGAAQAVENAVNDILGTENLQFTAHVLPAKDLKDTTDAVIRVSVANLRRKPGHSSELVDQALMGMPVKLLKKRRYWYLVQTPSEYLGWMTAGSFTRIDKTGLNSWQEKDKIEIAVNFCQVYEEKSVTSQVVSDLVLGCVLERVQQQGVWTKVRLPDGREGFIRTNYARADKPPVNSANIDRQALVQKSKTMLGIPYLWGGNSTKGLDCSGFTGNVFRVFGYQLPRDANMQVQLGAEIVPEPDYNNVLPGDLIFFGPEDRITHVGICLGGAYFIHCSDMVKINSLDQNDELYNEYRKRTFRYIKRIITN